jgi:thiol-disulfide isomerase/thioredoxin
MTRRWQLVTLAAAAFGLILSVVVLPPRPFAEPVMAALSATRATLEDRRVPAFSFVGTAGETISSESLAGRPVYLTFWAEYCDSCKSEMPSLEAFARAHRNDVEVLCVTVDEEPAAAYQWLARHFPSGPSFRSLSDPQGRVAGRIFGTTGVPETFVLAPDGRVVARFIGPQNFNAPAHSQLVSELRRR